MKRFLLLSIGCSACLIAGATTAVNAAESKATINAKGEVPSACFVTGTSLDLGLLDRNKLGAIGAAEMQSSGPASFALEQVSINKAPDFALKGGLSAQVLISSSLGKLAATDDSSGRLDLKVPLSDKAVETSVSVASDTGVLAAGTYELSTTLTCISN